MLKTEYNQISQNPYTYRDNDYEIILAQRSLMTIVKIIRNYRYYFTPNFNRNWLEYVFIKQYNF